MLKAILEFFKFLIGTSKHQLINHCGPKSLELCTKQLGSSLNQRDFARLGGARFSVFFHGMDEYQLKSAAIDAGFNASIHVSKRFANIKRILKLNPTALVCTWGDEHWQAIIKVSKNKVLLYDPYDYNSTGNWISWKELEEEMSGSKEWTIIAIE